MKYFFIDLENVRNEGLEGVMLLKEEDRVFIFYSDNAYTLSIPTYESINNSKAVSKYIKTNYIGKNAMDFQIVSLFGAMIEKQKNGEFYIISHDNGFKSAVSFCESYFTEYPITVGVCPTILAAIKSGIKAADRNASDVKPAKGGKARTKSVKTGENAQDKAQDKSAQKEEPAVQKDESPVKNDNLQTEPYTYIFEILKEILSGPTIALYAEAIDAAVAASANRNELHANYLERCGSDEGEALFKVTQGDFEELKKRRPAQQEKPQTKTQKRRRRARNNGTAQTETAARENETGSGDTKDADIVKKSGPKKPAQQKMETAEAENMPGQDRQGADVQEKETEQKKAENPEPQGVPDKPRRKYYPRRRRKNKTE